MFGCVVFDRVLRPCYYYECKHDFPARGVSVGVFKVRDPMCTGAWGFIVGSVSEQRGFQGLTGGTVGESWACSTIRRCSGTEEPSMYVMFATPDVAQIELKIRRMPMHL